MHYMMCLKVLGVSQWQTLEQTSLASCHPATLLFPPPQRKNAYCRIKLELHQQQFLLLQRKSCPIDHFNAAFSLNFVLFEILLFFTIHEFTTTATVRNSGAAVAPLGATVPGAAWTCAIRRIEYRRSR